MTDFEIEMMSEEDVLDALDIALGTSDSAPDLALAERLRKRAQELGCPV